MIVQVDRVVPRQHRQNRRHGEHVGDAVPLHQPPRLVDIQPFARHQHGRGAARDLRQRMHAGAVRQRRDHQRNVVLRRAGHQVAQMVADDVIHLAMRQHARFWPPGGAGGVEEPRRMVAIHVGRTGDDRRHRSAIVSQPVCEWKSPAGTRGFPLSPRPRARGKRRRKYALTHRTTSRDTRPPAGSDGNWSAPRQRRSSRRRTWIPARRWSCGRAAESGRHAARLAPPVPRPPPGPGR